jgi:HPr kinase/phosphorylase
METGGATGIRIAEILAEEWLGLTLLAGGHGLSRTVVIPRLQKTGLILAGHLEHLNPDKIQVFGQTEISFLRQLPEERLRDVVERFLGTGMICLVATKSLDPHPYLLETADRLRVPILRTGEKTSTFMKRLGSWLEKRLAPQATVHGVLMSIQGVGVLIVGKSGIGKSECSLDLVSKGHRLVADDLVYLQKLGTDIIVGSGPEMFRHHMEIRGLGILNVKDLFGVISVMDSSRVDLVVELAEWNAAGETDRLGLDEERMPILDVGLPKVRIPVSPGRNLSVILEVAARNHLLKKDGYHAARTVSETLRKVLEASGPGGAKEG